MWECERRAHQLNKILMRGTSREQEIGCVSSDAYITSIGSQPIIIVTHTYNELLASLWSRVDWSRGKKIVICDCSAEEAKHYAAWDLVPVVVNREHTRQYLKHSLDQSNLQWKAWDTSVCFASRQEQADFVWFFEGDVMFRPDNLSALLLSKSESNADLIGTGTWPRSDTWYWNRAGCNFAHDLRVGTLVSICRLSRRLLHQVVTRAQQNKACYLEKLFPSICDFENWPKESLVYGQDIHSKYSISKQDDKLCDDPELPLHACKQLQISTVPK